MKKTNVRTHIRHTKKGKTPVRHHKRKVNRGAAPLSKLLISPRVKPEEAVKLAKIVKIPKKTDHAIIDKNKGEFYLIAIGGKVRTVVGYPNSAWGITKKPSNILSKTDVNKLSEYVEETKNKFPFDIKNLYRLNKIKEKNRGAKPVDASSPWIRSASSTKKEKDKLKNIGIKSGKMFYIMRNGKKVSVQPMYVGEPYY